MGDIAEILKSVPEVKLRIIHLTWELLGEDGRIDVKKAASRSAEVDAALTEAEEYAQEVWSAVARLTELLRH